MVYVPILKIDLPEPRLQELLPGLVTAVLGACTLAFDAVHDYLRPLTPEANYKLYEEVITHLPREFRKSRKRLVEQGIEDEDKMSEELEMAQYAFYRRKMREDVCGYSDEDTEDLTFRRLMTPESATRDIWGEQPGEQLILAAAEAAEAGQPWQQHYAAAVGVLPPPVAAVAALPSRGRRAATTAATGGVGLALGMGVMKLAHLMSSRLRKGKKKAGKQRRPGGSQQSSRRPSEAGSATGAAAGSSSRRGSSSRGTVGRTTPRQQR